MDTANSVLQFARPISPSLPSSHILEDISGHPIMNGVAEERLAFFRRAFLVFFPFVHIPDAMSASELRHQRPFLWFNIMALTTKLMAEQFAMEEIIWDVVSRRVLRQQLADLDLLLGLVCFASWFVLLLAFPHIGSISCTHTVIGRSTTRRISLSSI